MTRWYSYEGSRGTRFTRTRLPLPRELPAAVELDLELEQAAQIFLERR